MGFIEPIARKALHEVIDLIGFEFRNAARFSPIAKDFAMLSHLFWLFLTHRTTQHISAAQRVTANHLRHLHNLLLIDHDAVGLA